MYLHRICLDEIVGERERERESFDGILQGQHHVYVYYVNTCQHHVYVYYVNTCQHHVYVHYVNTCQHHVYVHYMCIICGYN